MTDLPASAPRGQLERRRPPGRAAAELTPAEKVLRRRNRRLMLLIAIPAAVVGLAALIAAVAASSSGPTVRPTQVPARFKAVSDGYFAYAVPSVWSTNTLFTDDVGDLETSGPTGWVAEHLSAPGRPPGPGATPPAVFRAFGVAGPVPPALSIRVSGASPAYLYRLGAQTAVDAWRSSTGTEVWILISASPQITSQIISTLKA